MGATLGQHFMVDEKILDSVVNSAELNGKEIVLEIGPGKGAMTGRLCASAKKVIAIERDSLLASALEGRWDNLEVIDGDALRIDWPSFDKCISNLPYFISKPFILSLLAHEFELAVIVVQEEFAQKLVTSPGSKQYGVVSACTQLCAEIELLDKIPKNAFSPQPKVKSRAVRLRQKKVLEKDFLEGARRLFTRRNQKIGEMRLRDMNPKEIEEYLRAQKWNHD